MRNSPLYQKAYANSLLSKIIHSKKKTFLISARKHFSQCKLRLCGNSQFVFLDAYLLIEEVDFGDLRTIMQLF